MVRYEPWFERTVKGTELVLAGELPAAWRPEALRDSADALCGLGRWEECQAALERLQQESSDPSLAVELRVWLGESLLEQDPGAALDAYRQAALGAGPAATYARYGVVRAQIRAGALYRERFPGGAYAAERGPALEGCPRVDR